MKIVTGSAALIAIAALLTASAPTAAQTIGFKVGPTFSSWDVSGEAEDGNDRLNSIGGGGFVRFGMAGLALQLEALAITKGASFEAEGVEGDLKITYLEVPLLARFSLGSASSFSPYVMAGPALSFELSCKASFRGFGLDESADCEDADTGGGRRSMDIGAAGVAGFEFAMGPGALLVEGRYTHGLTNLNKDTSQDNDQSVKNRSFAIMAGYTFTLR